jgi:hypothetical protein
MKTIMLWNAPSLGHCVCFAIHSIFYNLLKFLIFWHLSWRNGLYPVCSTLHNTYETLLTYIGTLPLIDN